jgi:cation transport regulator ChaC
MIWLFAYAELMGEHLLRNYEAQPALLRGYRRAFVHASTLLWGTPEHPGPRVGLVPGGECWGLGFRVPWWGGRRMRQRAEPTENVKEYRRVRVPIVLRDGATQHARVWVSRPKVAARMPWPTDDALSDALLAAHGTAGRGVEYARTIFHALELWGLHDPMIEAVWGRLAAWRPH